ncbi:MAG: lipid-A-disaccharide synthase N-terminal domain-containing protein [Candidatus Omnitrophota bacterium]
MSQVQELGWFWMAIGMIGLIAFSMRFIVQWIASEKKKESVIPISFWYLSIVGSTLLLIYSIRRSDPVMIPSYLFNSLIYGRNLYLIYAKKSRDVDTLPDAA